jgi:PKD domain
VVDKPGTYVVRLIVNDGTLDSVPATVTITTMNSRPVANAGTDQTVLVGATVQLDGSASRDADGDALLYRWSLTAVPLGSIALLSDPSAVKPTFQVDLLAPMWRN